MKRRLKIFFLFCASQLLAQNLSSQTEITGWAYQLQNIDISAIAINSSFDLIVIDYSRDGSDQNKFTVTDINKIKQSGKKAIAYISIGEAENYRYYWHKEWDANNDGNPDAAAPVWLGKQNPNWAGNYKVKFWYPEWENIIYNYIDTIIAQNFDGIYCDIIDAYYYWSEEQGEQPYADTLMIDFLADIRKYINGKTDNPFYIIPQNGEYIIEENNVTEILREKYFSSIDAIGIEDVFFYGDADENNFYNPDTDRLNLLSQFIEKNKTVLSVEYLTQSDLITKYIDNAKEYNFIPYASVRALDVLNNGIPLKVFEENNISPSGYVLYQNYPNPFNPTTTINYTLYSTTGTDKFDVKLTLFDLLGRKIKTLVNTTQNSGKYNIIFNASALASGFYLYRLQVDNNSTTKTMLLLK